MSREQKEEGIVSEVRQQRVVGKESLVRVACAQFEPRIGEKERNISHSVELIHRAADQGSRLIVLPELCNSGYVFNTRDEAWELSEPVPGGPTTEAWAKAAGERNVYIAAGIDERDGDCLYNSAVLIGPAGHIGTFRKVHLWYEEKLFFEPGNLGFPVYHTPLGRIAMIICYDMWFPESYRLCTLQGADIVCVSTNWVPINGQRADEKPMALSLLMANAHVNGLYMAAADRVGSERGQPFLGHSVIVDPAGWPIAGPASGTEEEIITADCNLVESRRAKAWNDLNLILRDRRTDLYDTMLGAPAKPFGW